jgi:hypothetical protein
MRRVRHSAHYDYLTRRPGWPLPATDGCDALARAARAAGVQRGEPHVGDSLLLRGKRQRRFLHAGIIIGVEREEEVWEHDVPD